MSYDVRIGEFDINYTWNGNSIFFDHIPENETHTGGINALNGKTGAEGTQILGDFFDNVCKTKNKFWRSGVVGEPDFCAKYDPPNGWGSTVGSLLFAARILAACARYPDETIYVS